MICIVTKRTDLAKELKQLLSQHGIASQVLRPGVKESVDALYGPDVVAAVVDNDVPTLPEHAWLDMLASLGRRIPVCVVSSKTKTQAHGEGARYTDSVSWLTEPSAKEILSVLDACGAIGIDHRKLDRNAIPLYNPQVPLHMLQNDGALSVLVINATSFRKIAIEYGSDAYHRVQDCFQQMLYDLWGAPGSFRAADILCRRSAHSNTYYIFLEQSRSQSGVPAPGVLERLADRLAVKLQNAFWNELFRPRGERMMPDCINVVPDIAVGFTTMIYNPCVDPLEHVEQLLETAHEESRIQSKRMRDRQRELMQTLIQTPNLLIPHYQAVFDLRRLTKEDVDEARAMQSLKPLEHLIFGFESLIRVRRDAMDQAMEDAGIVFMESKYLRPDILFAMAAQTKLSLELDQACLHQAVLHSADLGGILMCNVLPRNLYYIDRLKHLIMDRKDIMFEVSESEAINNFDLMMKVRQSLEEMNMGIASDDFGKGYAGLEQIIRIKPDLIKLDRSLIQDIHLDKPKQAFVTGLVRATQISNTNILAEGVEAWEEAELLKSLGINLIQGFLLHRPQPAEAILKDLRQKQSYDTVA